MSYNQHELGRRFQRGETTGTASNMKIHETDQGGTILVGYGHAVYALRTAEGFIVTFAGWANSSTPEVKPDRKQRSATSQQPD